MKKFFASLLLISALFTVSAQPPELLRMWKALDELQFANTRHDLNLYYLHISQKPLKAVNDNVHINFDGIDFGNSSSTMQKRLEERGFIYEYHLNDNVRAIKFRGRLFDRECNLYVDNLVDDVIAELYVVFKEELSTIEEVTSLYDSLSTHLSNIYGEPARVVKTALSKYFPYSTLREGKEFALGNIYNVEGGSVVLTVTTGHTVSSHDKLRCVIYFVDDKALNDSIKN